MKVALCFSGQPRSFRKGYEYYKRNLFDHYDVDVFYHTWNDFEEINELNDLYKPKSYILSDRLNKELVNGLYPKCADFVNFPPFATVSAFYSIFQSNYVKTDFEIKNGFVYDWVIRTRFDYALNLVIPFNEFDSKRLYVPHCRMNAEHDFCNDQFAFSSSVNMNKYMSTYLYLNHFYDQGIIMNGEQMLQANLRYHKLIRENMIYVDMNNPFPPGPFNGTPHSLIRDDMDVWKNK